MKKNDDEKTNQQYEIIPTFSNNGKNIENVIESAFLKYLKFNDYR